MVSSTETEKSIYHSVLTHREINRCRFRNARPIAKENGTVMVPFSRPFVKRVHTHAHSGVRVVPEIITA